MKTKTMTLAQANKILGTKAQTWDDFSMYLFCQHFSVENVDKFSNCLHFRNMLAFIGKDEYGHHHRYNEDEMTVIRKYADRIDFSHIPTTNMSIDFAREFKDRINWRSVYFYTDSLKQLMFLTARAIEFYKIDFSKETICGVPYIDFLNEFKDVIIPNKCFPFYAMPKEFIKANKKELRKYMPNEFGVKKEKRLLYNKIGNVLMSMSDKLLHIAYEFFHKAARCR